MSNYQQDPRQGKEKGGCMLAFLEVIESLGAIFAQLFGGRGGK